MKNIRREVAFSTAIWLDGCGGGNSYSDAAFAPEPSTRCPRQAGTGYPASAFALPTRSAMLKEAAIMPADAASGVPEYCKVTGSIAAVDGATAMRGRTRPMCEYPTWPRHNGAGDVNSAASFTCVLG